MMQKKMHVNLGLTLLFAVCVYLAGLTIVFGVLWRKIITVDAKKGAQNSFSNLRISEGFIFKATCKVWNFNLFSSLFEFKSCEAGT
jgi:hypothetical protein